MWKHAIVLIGLLFALLIAGCGGSTSSSHTTISGITPVAITDADLVGKTAFYIKITDVLSTSYSTFSLTTSGNLVLTADGSSTPQTFTCIQKETDYWLVFDVSSNKISRLYSDPAKATAYNPTIMGGSIQGTPLSLTTTTTVPYGGLSGVAGLSVATTYNDARFNLPRSITTDGTNYYVADSANNVIRKIDPTTGIVSIFAGNPSGTAGSTDGTTGDTAYFNQPAGITTDGTNLYVADYGNHTIRQIVIGSSVVTTIAGVASTAGSVDSDKGKSAYFNSPIGITTDGANLYVADSGNHIIRKVKISTHAVSTIAGSSGSTGTDNGTYTNARFNLPTRITMDGSNLYVTDLNNRTIRKIVIATGTVSTLAGNPDSSPGAVDGTGSSATFYYLGGITTDGTYLYVGDHNDFITNSGDSSKNVPWRTYIRKVYIGNDATLYGSVTTIAGGVISVPNQYSVGGIGTDARFVTPLGITTDGTSLLITNSDYNNISQIK